jgi:hypothetical protein
MRPSRSRVFYNERILAGVVHDSSTPTQLLDDFKLQEYFLFNHAVDPKEPDYDVLHPNFLYKSDETIKKTFERSTQMARIPMSQQLRIPRRNEDLLTDYVYSDVPAIDDGSTGAQVFFGRDTHVGDVYGLKSEGHFPNASFLILLLLKSASLYMLF